MSQIMFHTHLSTFLCFWLLGVEQMVKDWVSGNWYMADESFDRLFVCNKNFTICNTLVAGLLDKPKDLAIDPSRG